MPLATGLTQVVNPGRPADRRHYQAGMALGIALTVLAFTGCAQPESQPATADEPTVRPNELAVAGDRPCPRELPVGDDPSGHGFGNVEPAQLLPVLLEPHEAWVCKYNTFDQGATDNGGVVFGWRRSGPPEPVSDADLPAFRAALDDLALADGSRICTDDLGARWMVVLSHEGDLTGVVVDDYGCRDVRLTDNPHGSPPGADDQEGTVGGVFDGGAAILEAVGVGRTG